jgi:hypothetical protein
MQGVVSCERVGTLNPLLVQLGVEGAIAVHSAPGGDDAEGAVAGVVGRRHRVHRRREPAVVHGGAPVAGVATRPFNLAVAFQQLCERKRRVGR